MPLDAESFPLASPAWDLLDQLEELLATGDWRHNDARLRVLSDLLVMLRETAPLMRDAGGALAVVVEAVHDFELDRRAPGNRSRAEAAVDQLRGMIAVHAAER
jgi:hypothetical protein